MKKNGFTMVELVFVIVVLGILAAVATTILNSTRTDSNVAILRNDVAVILKQVPARVFAENTTISEEAPEGYSTWGDWLMDTPLLDGTRWQPTDKGLQAVTKIGNAMKQSVTPVCEGEYLYLDTTKGELYFLPANIDQSKSICKAWYDTYSSNSSKTIELVVSQRTIF